MSSRKLVHHFYGYFHLCNIFLYSEKAHTSCKGCTESPWAGSVAPARRSLTAIIWLAMWAVICITGSNSSKKYNCFSLLSSEFGVTSSSSFSSFALSKRADAINNFLLWKVQETAVWILVLIAKSQEVQDENRTHIVDS